MMEEYVEHELCSNCKKEIPHFNYVMHTAHCQRNIVLCTICKEPVPKNEMENHKKQECLHGNQKLYNKENVPTKVENIPVKKLTEQKPSTPTKQTIFQPLPVMHKPVSNKPKTPALIACEFCELELPKKDLDEHIVYCGSRTEKCDECGELVMFKYQQLHLDSNHGFLKLNDEPGPVPSWEQQYSKPASSLALKPKPMSSWEQKPKPERPKLDIMNSYSPPSVPARSPMKKTGPKFENTKEMVRRVDCKTEYIRNLLHETALQTMPIRSTSTGAVPRNHRKGPAPPPPVPKTMPPTEIKIPCEFCHDMVDADDLVRHETGCRPDLARYIPKTPHVNIPARQQEPLELATPASPEVELPCEFCSSLIPASKLLRHQASCD